MNTPSRRGLIARMLIIHFTIALTLSLAITLINASTSSGSFATDWLKGFIVANLVMPVALKLIPVVGRAVRAVLGRRPAWIIRSVMSICVAILMESVVAFAVTLVQQGFSSGLAALWLNAFVKALPVGLLIGFTMTFIVQPRMQRLAASLHASPAQ